MIQVNFSYSDGFGREIQKKAQAAPGPVTDSGTPVNPRWIGSGWTVFNNKGKPVRKYEPFFSQLTLGHQFEFGTAVGVSPIVCYDPAGRPVAIIHPDHSYEKVVFDPWSQAGWDCNDTVGITDPSLDTDVGGIIARLPAADYMPTWYTQQVGGTALQQAAAAKTAVHADTPSLAYFDTLGRTFLSIVDNGAAGTYSTRNQLDIKGNIVTITDALGREAINYVYDMLDARLTQASMEAGQRWTLNDCTGKPIRQWDSRGHNQRIAYDMLRRPTDSFVLGTDPVNSDPRTTTAEVLVTATLYGETQNSPELLNLRTRVFQHCDSAGVITNTGLNPATGLTEAYDFKGNLLRSTRGFVADYQQLPDLTSLPATPDTFASSSTYDALNRAVTLTTPDSSVATVAYDEASLPLSINVNLRGAAAQTNYVASITYNAKGQRLQIAYGNGASTSYAYDELTFRLTGLTTSRPSFPANQQTVQDLAYTYDPSGNITHIQDDADIQNAVFFRNRRVEPSADYTYDPIYRLIQASGRELLGLNGTAVQAPAPTSYNDIPRAGLLLPGDGNAMGTYTEQYQYDNAGNFLQLIHQGSDPANPGWSRAYSYNEPSLLEPAKFSNRLSQSSIAGNQPLVEPYTYNLHGSMASMPQLQLISWDFKEQLLITQRQVVNASDADGRQLQGQRTYYVYDSTGMRVRKVTESAAGIKIDERFYVGLSELYREFTSGNVTFRRETLTVMDDKRCIARVETATVDPSQPASSLPSSVTRYQFDNHLGSACLELDDTAAVITYEEYYPYGGTSYQAGRSAAEVNLKRYRHTGKERDEETGLYYHGARYYACWLGRWTACDPSGLKDGTNLYQYVRSRPTNLIDPKGTDSQGPAITGIQYLESPEWKSAVKTAANYDPRAARQAEERRQAVSDDAEVILAARDSGSVALDPTVANQLEQIYNHPDYVVNQGVKLEVGDAPILHVLAALAAKANEQFAADGGKHAELGVASLFRKGGGLHQEGMAADISMYKGKPFSAKDPTYIDALKAMVTDLPEGNYGIGLPRLPLKTALSSSQAHDDQASHPDYFEPLPENQTPYEVEPNQKALNSNDPISVPKNEGVWFDRGIKNFQAPMREEMRKFSDDTAKNLHVNLLMFFPDGFDHVHLSAVAAGAKYF